MGKAKKKIEKKKQAAQTKSGKATVASNKTASLNFHLEKEITAGIMLKGSEVKSIRNGSVQMKGAYVKIVDGEPWLFNCHVSEYKYANRFNHDPDRAKKLLLNKYEIERLELETKKTSQTIIAKKIFFKANKAKVIIALGTGKKTHDKRADLKKKSIDRDIQRGRYD